MTKKEIKRKIERERETKRFSNMTEQERWEDISIDFTNDMEEGDRLTKDSWSYGLCDAYKSRNVRYDVVGFKNGWKEDSKILNAYCKDMNKYGFWVSSIGDDDMVELYSLEDHDWVRADFAYMLSLMNDKELKELEM